MTVAFIADESFQLTSMDQSRKRNSAAICFLALDDYVGNEDSSVNFLFNLWPNMQEQLCWS